MTKLGELLKQLLHSYKNETNTLVHHLSKQFTRVNVNPEKDFAVTYNITKAELVVRIAPISDYGEFILRKIYDAECQEEISKE